MGFRMLRSAAAVLAVVLLAGCVPGEPVVTPEPDPDVAPVFASDEEALAAATEAYAKFQAALDLALSTYETTELRMLATAHALDSALDLASKYETNGWRQIGDSTVTEAQLVMVEQPRGLEEEVRVQIYACHEVSEVDVVDASGESIVESDRPDRTPWVAMLLWDEASGHLVVETDDVWGGSNFCR